MTFFPWMARCQSVAIEGNSSALTALFCADGRQGSRGGVGWGVVIVPKRVGGVGGVWRGPLRPLNWHVQARGFGRAQGALIRRVTVLSYFLQP